MSFQFPDPWPGAAEAARVHAVTEYPREAVGVVLSSGEYVPLTNIHPDPENAFEVAPDEMEPYHEDVVCLIHSHGYKPEEVDSVDGPLMRGPSRDDMIAQQSWDCAWGLIVVVEGTAHGPVYWGGDLPRAPLLGRPFIFGIYDCLTALRDWYAEERQIDLPDFPREFSQIEANEDLYMPHVEEWGFRIIDEAQVEIGDVLLWRARSPVVNHAAVYLGGGLMLHHLRGSLSTRQPVARWRPHMTLAYVARYHGDE